MAKRTTRLRKRRQRRRLLKKKMGTAKKTENFMEIENVQDANKINLKQYSFIKFSDTRNCYIFKKKQKYVNEE